MPDTRPGSVFNKDGVCLACLNYEKRVNVDWAERFQQLVDLCKNHRRKDGYYDCVIAVSGGKDSYYIVHVIKELLGMNPLLVTVTDPFTKTEAGKHNLSNLIEVFNCDHIAYTISPDFFKRATRFDFEEYGEPLKFIEVAIYISPIRIAQRLGINLVFYGENPTYDYGVTDVESPFVTPCLSNMIKKLDIPYRLQKGFAVKEMNSVILPTKNPDSRYLGHYVPWESTHHLSIAQKYGFRDLTHEWLREGCSENFEQIDSFGYLVHIWLKYPKFGFQRVADIESRRVREGIKTRDEAMELVNECDYKLDRRALDDFVNTLGYTHKEFWDIVDKWNKYL